jgi:hypothetical protein
LRIDALVVGDVVTEVYLRGRKEGSDPDAVDAQILQIVEMVGDAVEIADAVAIGVPEAARVDLVDDGVMPPRLGIRNRGPLGESQPAEQRDAREKTQNQTHESPFEQKYPLRRGTRGGAISNIQAGQVYQTVKAEFHKAGPTGPLSRNHTAAGPQSASQPQPPESPSQPQPPESPSHPQP